MISMRTWLAGQDWKEVYDCESPSEKAETLQSMLFQSYQNFFPEKTLRIISDDQPWMNQKLKKRDRKRKREYNKHRKSENWKRLDKSFKTNVKLVKSNFYKRMMGDLMTKNTSKWYTTLKRMTAHDQQKNEKVIIPDMNHLSDKEQAESLANHFSKIPNEYEQLRKEDITILTILERDIPQFSEVQVWEKFIQLKTNKSIVKGDIPVKIYKEFAAHITEPLTHIYNSSLMKGEYPAIYKFETSTPVPKKYPVEKMDQMRNITGLLTPDKVFEKLISEIIISDMKEKADLSGNQKENSIKNYLIKMIHRIHTALDRN